MEKDQVTDTSMIIIGGSAGSLQVVFYLLGQCPQGFRTPILIVLHRDPQGISRLAELLATKTSMPVREIEDKEPVEEGCVYVCPPDYHTLIENDQTFSLDYSEKINFSRPSIDVTFRSAAGVYGKNLVCILLSGANADGAEGLSYVRDKLGTTIVHNPEEAEVSYMPAQALLQGKADHVFGKDEIAAFMQKFA
jgi:two-component system, chemotaxis family, protein-glutamate methylesterase/glutaminase